MPNRDMSQSYVVKLAFPGKKPFFFGNVVCDANAPMHEVQAAASAKLTEYLPDGWVMEQCIPGAIWMRLA